MILHGNQRGGARDLAIHLMKPENEHIEVHSLRGFACEDLMGALLESEALAEGTRCRQHLFSMSFNPPPGRDVSTEDFERAVERAEAALGLTDQPRAIVFHEKEARRHLHAVWSRIDGETMKAIQLSHSKMKMREVSRELFIEHGWTMPRGLVNSHERDPRNFTLEEWQQAKRKGRDPREIKTAIQDAWATSDTQAALAHALEARGFRLAKGDRKSVVVVDQDGEVRSLARSAGIKARDIRGRLKDMNQLANVEDTRGRIAEDMLGKVGELRRAEIEKARSRKAAFEQDRLRMVDQQRTARDQLRHDQELRSTAETKARQDRYREGLRGLWDKLRGEHARIKAQNERETYEAYKRDQAERDRLVQRHLDQRRDLTQRYAKQREEAKEVRSSLREDWRKYQEMRAPPPPPAPSPTPEPEPKGDTSLQDRLDRLRRGERGPPTPDRER